MSLALDPAGAATRIDWLALVAALGPKFEARATAHDESDRFVAENFAELKAGGILNAPIPQELGGGGASYATLCEILRALAHSCSSTALALSMHTHIVATLAWRWRQSKEPLLEALLRRVAHERQQLVTSGASDWLSPSGKAERVEGGWQIEATKIFVSGIPTGDLFVTQAIHHDLEKGPTALLFAISTREAGVLPQDTWRALGMRGTGSQDVVLRDVFVPDSAVILRRPAGKMSPPFHVNPGMIPLPLVYSVYLGIAEAARDRALTLIGERRKDLGLIQLAGEMENDLALARILHRDMVEAAEMGRPGLEATNRIWTDRTLIGRAVLRVVERAIELGGGRSFYRSSGLERLFRDAQGARFHRPQERTQLLLSGRLALGMGAEDD
jgi:alkylation response protein AidB-like acyl-CoA dehydrogenase